MKTKVSIDKHAKLVLSQAGGKDGKHSFNLARLYFEAHCYEEAKTYINSFLQSVGNSDWRAHKLLADIELAEGCEQDALHTYKDVLRLQPDCRDALMKVALLAAKLNPIEQAEKWLKEIERRYPCEAKVTEIRDIVTSRKSGDHLSDMRQKSAKNPADIDAQCQYLNELINCGQKRQAFDHVVERVGMFNSSLQWQRTSEMVLENFMATSPSTDREQIGNFMILATYYRQILLTVATAPLNSTKQLIQKLDRGLYRFVSGYEIHRLDDSSELNCCAKEVAACLLTATVLVINKVLMQRTFSLSSVDILFMSLCKAGLALQPHKNNFQWVNSSFSYNVEGTSTCVSPHFEQSSRTIWNVLATERMTLLSHVVNAVKNVQKVDSSLFNSCKLSAVKDQLINIVYPATTVTNSSFLANYLYLLEPFYPNLNEIDHSYNLSSNDVYVRDFFKQTCESIENVCWIILSRSGFPKCENVGSENLRWMLSDKLPLSVEMNANRVSNVDLQAFALATSYWMGQHLKYYNKVSPFLPTISLLCSIAAPEQIEVWRGLLDVAAPERNSSGKVYAGAGRHLNQSLQIIRANVSGLPTAIQIALARSFQKLSESSGDSTWTDVYKQRSAHYWEKVLPSIKHLCRGQSNIVDVEQERNNKLFPVSVLPTLKPDEARKYLDEGSMFVASWYRTQGNLDASLSCLQKTESVALSPQSALMKAEVLQDKSLIESNEDRETQRELLTTSFGEISSILKKKDLPVAVKKEAHKQLNSVVNKLTELDRLAEVEANEAAAAAVAANSSFGQQRNGVSGVQNSEISNKLDSVSGELSSLNTNIQAMTDELKSMHVTWDQGLKEMTQNMKKLIDIQLTMHQRPVLPATVIPPGGQQTFIKNPMLVPGPQLQVPTLSQNPNPAVPGVYAPPGTQGQFLPPSQGSIAPNIGFQFRPPVAATSMPNAMSFPSSSDGAPIPNQMPVPQNPSLFGQVVPPTVVRQPVQPVYPIKQVPTEVENFQPNPNPMLSALLRAPNAHVEQKLNQPFQPPKMLSSVEHAQDSVPSSAKEPNPIPTLGVSPNVLTSTPKVPGNKVAALAAPKATVPGSVLPTAPASLIQQEGSSSTNSKKSLFSNIAVPKNDIAVPTSEPASTSSVTPQFSSLFGVKTTQAGPVPTTSSQIGFSFSSLKPAGTSSAVPSSAFSFKMAPPVVTFATPASVFSPSTASNTISGQPSAAVFTGFKGFQAPVSNLSQPEAQNQSKNKTASSLVSGATNAKATSIVSEAQAKTSPQKSQENKTENPVGNKGLGTLGSGSSFSFKFNMAAPPTAEVGKSPGKVTNTPEKSANTSGSALAVPANAATSSTTVASPGGNKEADDSTHDPQFEPIVHLDKVADLKTGEESEIELFCERAKLRRFVDGEWKERGVGDMKILKSQTAEKYRVVMRREQIKKLCANHVITDEMTIQIHPTNDKSLIWIANDFAEEEEVLEKLCVRFKSADVALKFKKVFEEGITVYGKANAGEGKSPTKSEITETKKIEKDNGSEVESKTDEKCADNKAKVEGEKEEPKKETVVETIGPKESTSTNSLASKFGLKPGQWNCDACLTLNQADVDKCAACNGPKDPKAASGASIAPVVGSSDAFGGGGKGPVFKFDTSKTSAGAFKFGVSSNAQTSSFKFGVTPSASKPEDKPASEAEKDKQSIFEGFKGFGVKPTSANSSTPLFGAPAFQPVSSANVSQDSTKSGTITTTTASLFGTSTESAKPTVTNSLFGLQSSGTSSIFGTNSATSSTSGIFGKTPATEGSSNAASAPISSGIFGKSAVQPANSGIFGKTSGTAPISSGGMIFGKGAGDGTGSMFGQSVFEKPRAELQTADDLSKEESEKCGVTFETEAEDDEIYYCEEDDGDYGEGEGYYPGEDEYYEGEGEEEYGYGENYEEPEEGEIFGYDEDGQFTDLDQMQNTPMRMTGGRLATTKPGQYMSPMARFDPNKSAGTPPQVTSVFGTKASGSVNPIAKVPVASSAEDFEKLDDKNDADGDKEEEIGVVFERVSDENPEHRALVEQFKLPPLFYDSLSKPECSGCIGCGDDPNLTNKKIYKDNEKPKIPEKSEVDHQAEASASEKETGKSLDASKTSGFLFGTQVQSGFSFASLASNAADQGGAFGLGSSTGKSTTFAAKPLFAGLNLGGETSSESAVNPSGKENPDEQEECDIHFKPIVQLEKVETKSGDEDSETIFSERAKLFRYTNGEWKERGVGEIKVMRYIPKNVGRIVMRRDVILKLCANHVIFKDMCLTPMNAKGKSFVWAATDFADDPEGSMEKFAVRFKTPELASKFEECFNKMRDLVHVE